MKKRLTALFLALALSLSALTSAAWAAEVPDEAEEPTAAAEEEAPAAEEESAEAGEELPAEPEETDPAEETPAEPEETGPAEETPAEPEETDPAGELPAEPETPEEEQPLAEASVDPDEGVMAASTVASGTCGDNLTWTLDGAGTLTISGTGTMTSYNSGNPPWHESRTSIKQVVFGDDVTSIGSSAFSGCSSLSSVVIPDGVTSIGSNAFGACKSLSAISVASGNAAYCAVDGVLFDKEKVTLLQYPAGKTSASYRIPDGVTSISGSAFSGCFRLSSVAIPESVTSIGYFAFSGCSGLLNVSIPDSMSSIGHNAFYNCISLLSITIPAGVTEIGQNAFCGCTSLTDVTILSRTVTIGARAFGYASSSGDQKTEDLTIMGHSGSTAQSYAKKCGITFKILLSLCTVSLGSSYYTYQGSAVKPSVTVTDNGAALKNGTDYIVSYSGNTNAGTGIVTVTGKGSYIGTVTETFRIGLATPNLSGLKNTSTGLKISWNKVSGAAKYAVYRKKLGESAWTKQKDVTGTSYTDTTVTSGVTYSYTVRARYGATMSAQNPIGLKLRYLALPQISSLKNESGGIRLAWKKTKGSSGYNIYRRAYGGSYSKIAVVKGASNLTYTDKSAKSGITYVYRVVAYSGSSVSAYESGTIYRLLAPTVTLTSPQAERMKISWNKAVGIGGYQYQISRSTDFSDAGTYSLTSDRTGLTVKNLISGKTYCVRMRTYKTVNGTKYYSAWSTVKSVKVK